MKHLAATSATIADPGRMLGINDGLDGKSSSSSSSNATTTAAGLAALKLYEGIKIVGRHQTKYSLLECQS